MGCGASTSGLVGEEEQEPGKKKTKEKKRGNGFEGLEDTAVANADNFAAATAVAGATTLVAGALNVRPPVPPLPCSNHLCHEIFPLVPRRAML